MDTKWLSQYAGNTKILRDELQQIEAISKMPKETHAEIHNATSLYMTALIDDVERRKATLEADRPIVEDLLNSLSTPSVRIGARLHYIDGYQWKEASAVVNLSEPALKNAFYRDIRCAIAAKSV